MANELVEQKLRLEILPWLESAKLLQRQWFCRAHTLFGYTTDLTVALGSIGIGIPLLNALKTISDDKTQQASAVVIPPDPLWLYYAGLGVAGVWILLRVTFNREDGQKRAVLAKSCAHSMKQCEAKLFRLLAQPNPMPELIKMADEQIGPLIDRNIQDGAYPWSGPAPNIESKVKTQLDQYVAQFGSHWTPAAAGGPEQR